MIAGLPHGQPHRHPPPEDLELPARVGWPDGGGRPAASRSPRCRISSRGSKTVTAARCSCVAAGPCDSPCSESGCWRSPTGFFRSSKPRNGTWLSSSAAPGGVSHRHRLSQLHRLAAAEHGRVPRALAGGGARISRSPTASNRCRRWCAATSIFAFTSNTAPDTALAYTPLFRYESLALLPRAHALSKRKTLCAEDIAGGDVRLHPVPEQRLDVAPCFGLPACIRSRGAPPS